MLCLLSFSLFSSSCILAPEGLQSCRTFWALSCCVFCPTRFSLPLASLHQKTYKPVVHLGLCLAVSSVLLAFLFLWHACTRRPTTLSYIASSVLLCLLSYLLFSSSDILAPEGLQNWRTFWALSFCVFCPTCFSLPLASLHQKVYKPAVHLGLCLAVSSVLLAFLFLWHPCTRRSRNLPYIFILLQLCGLHSNFFFRY